MVPLRAVETEGLFACGDGTGLVSETWSTEHCLRPQQDLMHLVFRKLVIHLPHQVSRNTVLVPEAFDLLNKSCWSF
jgi:hypothetical protein